MKIKKVSLLLLLVLSLTACNKVEEEYQSKKKDVDSVFDKIDVPNKIERESIADEDSSENEEIDDNNEVSENNNNEKKVMKTTSTINFRSTPEINDNNILGSIVEGTDVEILEENLGEDGTWAKISHDGEVGFVNIELLD